MTAQQLPSDALQALAELNEKATPGEWAVFGDGSVRRPGGTFSENGSPGATVCRPDNWEDAEFIAELVNTYRAALCAAPSSEAVAWRHATPNGWVVTKTKHMDSQPLYASPQPSSNAPFSPDDKLRAEVAKAIDKWRYNYMLTVIGHMQEALKARDAAQSTTPRSALNPAAAWPFPDGKYRAVGYCDHEGRVAWDRGCKLPKHKTLYVATDSSSAGEGKDG